MIKDGSYRVIREGSWFDGVELCRSAYPYYHDTDLIYHNVGLRLVSSSLRPEHVVHG